MGDDKPENAAGYDRHMTLACERALVTLLRGFGQFKNTVRLVGGLVPRYLTPEQPPHIPAHVGTTDVDVWLNLPVLAAGQAYAPLSKQLKKGNFRRCVDHNGKAHSWRWERPIDEHLHVMVEFLCDAGEADASGALTSVENEHISALGIRHAGIVKDWFQTREVTAELLDGGGITTEIVHFADVPAFLILKSLAFDQRAAAKDAADMIHVLQYSGRLEDTARLFLKRWNNDEHRQAIDEGLNALRRRFCGESGHERDGPVAVGRFYHGVTDDSLDERMQAQFQSSALVTELLRLIDEGQ